jgi:hypothetical protein
MAESDEESLLLAFKESGVEFVESAGKAVGDLGDKMETVNQAQAAAIEILKEEGTVVEDLKEKIRKLKAELETLNDATKAGLVPLDKYTEQSGKLVEVIRDSESTLKRLTAAEREQEQIADEVEQTLEKEAKAQAKVGEAASEAAAKIEEQTRAQEIAAGIADEFEKPLKRLAGEGDGESAEGGLKGVAGGAIKAEKAIKELVTGHGLMRLGSQLEGVVPLLGGPAGLGLAIGAVVIGLHDVIPALKTWFDTWQDGGKVIQDTTKAIKDFDTAQKTVHEDMKKRALHEVDKQIEVLEAEDRETKAAGLPEYNKDLLKRLQARSKAGHAQEKQEKEFAGIGPTKAKREMGAAVKEAISEAGGVDAVIGEDANDAARYLLQSAIDGDRVSIETLKRWSPEFAAIWPAYDPITIREIKRKEAGEKTIADVEKMTGKNVEKHKKDDEKHEKDTHKATATKFKDQVTELKSQLSDLGADLHEKTISPQEYKDKADVLVDAIAAAIQGLAKVPGEEIKTARRDIDAAQRQVRSTFDRGVEAVKHAADKAGKNAKTAADKANRDQEKFDREHTPGASERRVLTAQRNEEMGMAQDVQAARADAGDRMAAQMGPQELQQVVAAVGRNRMMNSTLGFTLAQQVDYYMSQLEAKMVADFTRGMGQHDRSGQLINPRGGH